MCLLPALDVFPTDENVYVPSAGANYYVRLYVVAVDARAVHQTTDILTSNFCLLMDDKCFVADMQDVQ
jgi:hypothetical protein